MQNINFVYAPPKSNKWKDEESLVFRHGNEDERVHTQINVMQQLQSELHCKKMIISKNDIQVSKVVGQGRFLTPNNSLKVFSYNNNAHLCVAGESGLVYCGYLDIGGGRDMVAVKTCKGKKHHITSVIVTYSMVLFLLLALSLASDKEKLLKEVTTMVSFKHPNVMSLIGVCFDGEMPLIIMPYMFNGSVLGYVKQNRSKLLLDREVNEVEVCKNP